MNINLKYLRYILIHKWYVFVECCKVGQYWRGIVHDLSKFFPSEFVPYREYFYGDLKHTNECSINFDYAWCKHQKRKSNSHHWQYWVLTCDSGEVKALDMPLIDKIECICDWKGAGMAINGKDDTLNWYTKNRDNMILHPNTRRWIEKEIGYIS